MQYKKVQLTILIILSFLLLGSTNTFGGTKEHNREPVLANIDTEQDVCRGKLIVLDGSSAYDPDGTIGSYLWEQTSGPNVELNSTRSPKISFTPPKNESSSYSLSFNLTVTDNNGESSSVKFVVTVQDCARSLSRVKQGDVNGDNKVDMSDSILALQILNGKISKSDVKEDTYYRDSDGDGYGDADSSRKAYSKPSGYVKNNTDCNDGDLSIHPGATEKCGDGIDQDCDGEIDDGCVTYYRDSDQDGYGNGTNYQQAINRPSGYVKNNTDCNDKNSAIHPGATEKCGDGVDQDCDGNKNNGCPTTTYYQDSDGDNYGNVNSSVEAYSKPSGYVKNNTDCNDKNSAIHPGATEKCGDGVDQDCDGNKNNGCTKTTYYRDSDGDGYGNAESNLEAYNKPTGYVKNNTDCNDGNPNINPVSSESCDNKDNDCDGVIDEGCTTYYQDADFDGYGNPYESISAKNKPQGYVAKGSDCNDDNPSIHPGAEEKSGDGVDQDCNGDVDTWSEPTTGMEFVYVEGGCYKMGCNSTWAGDCHSDETPVHEVCVDGFWISKYEVTQGQWKEIMGNNPSNFNNGDNYPVESVNWNDCQDFIDKLNSKSDKSLEYTNHSFRLPTEAEWEYAALSGGKEQKYAGSDNVERVAWYRDNSGGQTHEVGTKAPNDLGIYDMTGNVYEWCSDWYSSDYYSNSPTDNPQGPGAGSDRVARGGSWYNLAENVRTAGRDDGGPSVTNAGIGLRLVRTAD